MVRVICVGNRFYYPDDFGMRIYEELLKRDLDDIELVEGGVGGMSLSPYFDDDVDILIVDFGNHKKKILNKKDIDEIDIKEFDHATALIYLLKTIDRDFTIYLHNGEYDIDKIVNYTDEVLEVARGL